MEDKKIAIVTGASRGIGFSISSELMNSGYNVVGICRSVTPEVRLNWLKIGGAPEAIISADVASPGSIATVLENPIFLNSRIEVLVNNAGITNDAFFHKMTYEQWCGVIDVNLKSIFNVTQPIYLEMMKNKSGRIINISSINGQKGQAGQTNYSAAKAGIHGFTMALAQEASRNNITVNTISPGYTETAMTASIKPEILDSIKSSIPLKRLASTDEIAKCVKFLVSDSASYITGANIPVNGGLFIS